MIKPNRASGVIYDLCGGTGSWSKPYREAGYRVELVDLPKDVRLLEKVNDQVHGILCAPPCTVFSRAGAWVKRSDAEMIEAISIVDACIRFVVVHRPDWWALENPIGKLTRYLGEPVYKFQPWQFGDAWTKATYLWGDFGQPVQVQPVRVQLKGKPGSRDRTTMLSGSQRAARSATLAGFATAFFKANP